MKLIQREEVKLVSPYLMKRNDVGVIRKWGVSGTAHYIGKIVKKISIWTGERSVDILVSIVEGDDAYWNNMEDFTDKDKYSIELLRKGDTLVVE